MAVYYNALVKNNCVLIANSQININSNEKKIEEQF